MKCVTNPEAKYTLHQMVMILLKIWQGREVQSAVVSKSEVSNTMVKKGFTEMVTFKKTF